jgi:hypothetical protein
VVWGHVIPQPLLPLFDVPAGIRVALVGRRLPLAVVTEGAGHAGRQISRLDSCPMIWAANGLRVAIPSRTA